MKNRKRKRPKARLKLLPPTSAAARDEGPRLIPLADRQAEPSRTDHYLDLADTALNTGKDGKRTPLHTSRN